MGKQKTILIVDAEKHNVDLLINYLKELIITKKHYLTFCKKIMKFF